MLRLPPQPTESAIVLRQEEADIVVEIPQKGAGATAAFRTLFLLVWLVGWGFGFKQAASQLLSGRGNTFIAVWLAAWTIGGLAVGLTVFRSLRPTIPERLTLRSGGASFDSGIAPLQWNRSSQNASEYWKALVRPRRKLELDRAALRSLQLRTTDTSNRLTVDVGAERIDLAVPASEIEREWLYDVIARKYGLPARNAIEPQTTPT